VVAQAYVHTAGENSGARIVVAMQSAFTTRSSMNAGCANPHPKTVKQVAANLA